MKIERYGVSVDLSYEHKTGCPKCISQGRDRKGENLHVYGLGENKKHLGAFCFSSSCGYTIPSEDWLEENRPIKLEDMEYELLSTEFNKEVHEGIKSITTFNSKGYRGISSETSKYFGVRYECSQETGDVVASYYPVTKGVTEGIPVGDAITGYKIRQHPKSFRAVGKVGKESDLFGMFRFQSHKGILVLTAGECYSEDTEVLTDSGWKFFRDLNEQDLVCQIHGNTSSFVKPESYTVKNYTGKMLNYKGRSLDLLVTPNHKMSAFDNKGSDYNFLAKDMPRSKAHKYKVATKMSGKGSAMSDEQIQFIIAVTADCKLDTRASGRVVAHFNFKKERKIERLKSILDKLKLEYTEYPKGVTGNRGAKTLCEVAKNYHTFNVQMPSWCQTKQFPPEWLSEFSYEQRGLFLSEVLLWDGNIGKRGESLEFSSAKEVEVDYVMAMANTYGYYVNKRKRSNQFGEWFCVTAYYNKKDCSYQSMKVEEVDYDGNVYCVTVPTGELLVRRNWKTTVCGNCDQLSMYQVLKEDYDKKGNTKYDEVAVVSPTTGEGSISQIKYHYNYFKNFNKIIIAYDNDEAGRIATEATAQVLPRGKVFVMPLRNKDINEYIQKGMEKQLISDFWSAKPWTPDGVKSSFDGFYDIESELLRERITLPPYMHKLQNNMGGGFVQGGTHNIIAATGVSKTTHVRHMVYHMIMNSGLKPTIISLEETAVKYNLELLQLHAKENFMFGKTGQEIIDYLKTPKMAKLQQELIMDENGQPRYYILDERSGNIKSIEDLIEMLHKKHGSEIFICDVLSDLLRGSSADLAEDHMAFQRRMNKEGVTFFNTHHTRKPSADKDGKERKTTEYDVLGTGSFVQSGHTNIVLNRDKLAQNGIERNTTQVSMPKCRGGITGEVTGWFWDFNTLQCYDVEDYKKDNPHLFIGESSNG